MTRTRGRFVALAAAALVALTSTPLAQAAEAADPPTIVVADGVTQPVFGYTDAIRERIWVTADFDSDLDGVLDEVAMDIMRPAATADGLKVPVIMDASPYFTTVCRGNETECIADTNGDGINDKWPLFYDNYFVPRGYAVMLLHMAGTGFSTGCPVTGGLADNRSATMGIDWLNGRRVGHNAAGEVVTADWHNGKTGMIGKSYDGTLANATAAIAPEGLATIVPISAISNWYYYTRMNGIVTRGSSYPSSLANTVTNTNRRTYCLPIRNTMAAIDGDEHGDYTAFWAERDYLPDLDNVNVPVFVVHGLQDDNVRTNNFADWWAGLAENNVPRKIWLTGTGHIDPFDFRRAHWVNTLHRWFDKWLLGIENGIMSEPMADIETAADVFETHANWPVPTTQTVDLFFRPGTTNGLLGLSAGTDPATTSFLDSTSQSENTMINNPTNVTNNRRVFLSDPLTAPLRISGTPFVKLVASANRTDTNLGGIIMDYSTRTRISRTGDGISTLGVATETCWGLSASVANGDGWTDDPCYRETAKVLTTPTQWRVAKGILDAVNRDSVATPTPLVVGQAYDFTYDLLPNDYTFAVGSRIGIIIVGSYSGFSSSTDSSGATITLDLTQSRISLPIVGGYQAAVNAGAFLPDVNAPVLDLPADITTEATGPTTPVSFSVTATDAEDPAPVVNCDPASGSSFGVGTTAVNCTATDGAGNVGHGSFNVIVEDTTEPTFAGVVDQTFEGNATGGGTAAYTIPTASDIVDGPVAVTCLAAPGSYFLLGANTVDCSATDAAGNTAMTSLMVTIVDTTDPVLTVPASVTADATMPAGAVVTFPATAVDIVDAAPVVVCVPPSGSVFAIGDTTVTCTATDGSGNSTQASFDVHVKDAAEQLADLLADVAGKGPGLSLTSKVQNLQAKLASGDTGALCNGLMAFAAEVAAQAGKSLSVGDAIKFVLDAAQIRSVIGCA